jgi:polysaccharide export outer membrane protein
MKTTAIVLVLALLATCLVGAAEPAPAPAAPPAATTTGYKLFQGDLLLVQVFDNPDLERELRVPDSGTITYPLIGEVQDLVGRSIDDFTKELTRRLMDGYLRQAVVTVTVKEYGRRAVTVMGSVNRAGPINLDPLRTTTAMQAIGDAGGFTDDANREGTLVMRGNGRQALPVPKGDRAADLAADVVLVPGDIIIVPRLDHVFILGQVTKPGTVNLPSQEALTVSKAVSLAGGFDKFAKKGSVQLIRGGQRVAEVDVGKILTGDGREDPKLQPGDTVYVPESRF